jgi:hypothetical protein
MIYIFLSESNENVRNIHVFIPCSSILYVVQIIYFRLILRVSEHNFFLFIFLLFVNNVLINKAYFLGVNVLIITTYTRRPTFVLLRLLHDNLLVLLYSRHSCSITGSLSLSLYKSIVKCI